MSSGHSRESLLICMRHKVRPYTVYTLGQNTISLGSFREKVRAFADNLLLTSSIDISQNKYFNKYDFYNYICILINYCRMKKLVRQKEERDQLKMCYDVIYSYSHQKFNDFISVPEVATIIKIIISSVGISKIIDSNDTLGGDNKYKYEAHMIELLDKL